MSSVFVIGGTRFIGRHTVAAFLAHDDAVTLFNRGNHENPFAGDERVDHIAGNRTDSAALASAAASADPDIVIDCVAYHPEEVRDALQIFDDVDAYVFVSSVAAYADEPVIKYEDETPLKPCSPEEAADDSFATYGPRKGECDRVLFDTAGDVRAMSVRPSMVYGPHDYIGNMDYWIDRVANHERVLIPGDGSYLCHRSYVEDVATAIRLIAENGVGSEAYNVGDRQPQSIDQTVQSLARVLGREPEIVHASERELATAGLAIADFPYYRRRPPFVLSTDKLAALGWASTPTDTAMRRTVDDVIDNNREPQSERTPSREDEVQVLDALA